MGLLFFLILLAVSFYLGYKMGINKISRTCPWCGNFIDNWRRKDINKEIDRILKKQYNKTKNIKGHIK